MAATATRKSGGRVKPVEAPVVDEVAEFEDELADLDTDPNATVEDPAPIEAPTGVAAGDEANYESLEDQPDAMSVEDLLEDLGEAVEDEDQETKVPLIRGARVVYLGARRNKSVAMTGRIIDEPVFSENEFEMEKDPETGVYRMKRDAQNLPIPKRIGVVKTCGRENGNQSYDFSTHDARKRPILSSRMPNVAALGEVANKRYILCEHPDHLLFFQRSRDEAKVREFRIFVPKKYRPIYRDYVMERDAQAGRQKSLQKFVTS